MLGLENDVLFACRGGCAALYAVWAGRTLFELLRSQTNNANTKENGEFQICSDFEIISSGCCFLSNQKLISSISGRKAFEVDLTT